VLGNFGIAMALESRFVGVVYITIVKVYTDVQYTSWIQHTASPTVGKILLLQQQHRSGFRSYTLISVGERFGEMLEAEDMRRIFS